MDKTDKGISFLIAIGSYGGFYYTSKEHSKHLCLGWIAFTLFLYDVENAMAEMLSKKESN